MRVGLRATSGWGVVLGAWLLAGCGDVTGNPIRSITTADAGLRAVDAGHDMLDATSAATLPAPGNFPPMSAPGSPNQGPGSGDSMHDGHGNDVVPHIPYCAGAANWSDQYTDDEEQLVQAINETRARRVSCGGHDDVQLPRLYFAAELRCSARIHSFDMAFAQYHGRLGSDGSTPSQRMTAAGFAHTDSAESLPPSTTGNAGQVLFDLLGDPDDCANLASREFTAVGVGEYAGVWTVDFAAEP